MDKNPGQAPNPAEANPPAENPQPAAQPVTESNNQTTPEPAQTTEPAAAPAEGAEIKPKKKKTGLIIGIVLAVLALIGGGVAAAIVFLNPSQPGTVAGAVDKLLTGEIPTNVKSSGDITVSILEKTSPIKSVKLAFNSDYSTKPIANVTSATLTLTNRDNDDASILLDEVFVNEDDIYFKVDGIVKFLKDSNIFYYMYYGIDEPVDCGALDAEEDCVYESTTEDVEIDVDAMIEQLGLSDIVDMVDGKWLHVSIEEITDMAGTSVDSSAMTCFENFKTNLDKNRESIAQHYRDNAFIISIDENVTIPSKKYAVHKIKFDTDKLISYIDTVQKTAVIKELSTCFGKTGDVKIDNDSVVELVSVLPELYVEIDNDNNLSRLLFEVEDPDETVKVKVDLSFEYPASLNVTEPSDYEDLMKVIQKAMTKIYNVQSSNATVNKSR